MPNIGLSTTISSTIQLHLQHFRKLICIQCESTWCQYQIFVLAPQYPVQPNYTPSTSENSCVFSVKQVVLIPNIGFSATISSTTEEHPQQFGKLICTQYETRCCQMLNIGLSTTISHITKLHPQHFGKLMCIQCVKRWCQYQILVLAPQYPVLPNYSTSTSENSCVLNMKPSGASAKYWCQRHIIQYYQITPPALQKTHVSYV